MSKVYDIITDRIVKLLEEGSVPWRRPWGGKWACPRKGVRNDLPNNDQTSRKQQCKDASPALRTVPADGLDGRCVDLPLARRDLAKPFAARAQEIAKREGLDGKPLAAYVRLCQKLSR